MPDAAYMPYPSYKLTLNQVIARVDRILDVARNALDVVGNALAVRVMAKREHKFDRKRALAYERELLGQVHKTAEQ